MPVKELSDLFCRSAKPVEGKQTDYFDTLVKGLCLTVSPGGTKTWNLFYTKPGDGRRARMKLGRYTELKLTAARTRAREERGRVGDQIDPIAEKRARAASQTVSDVVENYIARHASTKRSANEIARRLRKNVKDVIGDVKLAELHRRDITRCIDEVKDRGAHIEANRLFEDMRAMVRWARARGDIDSNLVEGMRRPTEVLERDRALDADEIRTMWVQLAEADMLESTRDIIRLCLITAQRVGEVAGMTHRELDLARRTWTIPAARAKNKRDHVVPLSDMALRIIADRITAAEALAKRKKRTAPDFVFPAPGGRAAVSAAAVPKAVKRQEKQGRGGALTLGVAPWTPHDLRRTAATMMEEIGVSPFIVGHVLNHVSITKSTITSRVYARYDYAREKREALDLWADRLTGIIRGADVVPLQVSR